MYKNLKNVDFRQQQFLDEMKNSKIALENIKQDDKQAKIKWKLSQLDTYPESIDLNPSNDGLRNFINEEASRRETNDELLIQDVYIKLLKVTTKEIGDYIVANLTEAELLNFNRNYKRIITELKKNNEKISKEQFVDFLKTYNISNPIKYTDNNRRRRIIQEQEAQQQEEEKIPDYDYDEEEEENDLRSWLRNKTTDAYNPKLPDVRDEQDRIRFNQNQNQKEVEGSDLPKKPFILTNIFFGIEFQNKTQLNNYMNKSDISINDINTELDLLGELKQKTKKDGKKILLGHFFKPFIPTPTKQGKGLTKRLYINSKHFLDEGELEKNNLVMKSNNTNRIIYNMKPVKIAKNLKEVILLTLQKTLIKKNIIN